MLSARALLLVILLSVSSASWADWDDGELIESWRCSEHLSDTKPLLTLSRYQGEWGEYGVVTLPGVEPIVTFFRINGLERRWDWEWDDALGGYQYAVVVELDGDGVYFDFSGIGVGEKILPSERFQCKKV